MLLTCEQSIILKEHHNSFRVLAAAGSGKTTTMSYYVKSEIDNKRCKEDEICFITFTRFAADQIKKKIRSIMGKSTMITTGTFHATMFKLRRAANIEFRIPDKLYDGRMEEYVIQFMSLMKDRNPDLVKILSKFRLLIVDEFQDLDDTQFQFIKEFKQIQPDLRVIAIGDLAQNIYRFRGTSNEFLRTRLQAEIDVSLKSFTLTTNFRSSKEILTFVNFVFDSEIKEGHILPMNAPENAHKGNKVSYYEYAKCPGKGIGEYEELVVDTLIPIIQAAKKSGKSIVLIFPIIKCQSYQVIIALLREYSMSHGFEFDIHQIAKEDETCNTIEFIYDPKDRKSPIQCSTLHSSKGLEWDIVALLNISDKLFELREGEEDSDAFYMEKINLLYVGITRAAEELYIFADANMGGRCRILSRLEEQLYNIANVILWGKDDNEPFSYNQRPIGITDLIRKLPQHPDLFQRIRSCSEHVRLAVSKDGHILENDIIYTEMKQRNRELAFGTYIDWKLKQILCNDGCKSKSLQDYIMEIIHITKSTSHIFSRSNASEDLETRLAKLDIHFINANKDPYTNLINYIGASRYMALFSGRRHRMVSSVRSIWSETEKALMDIYLKEEKTLMEEYILSQSRNFYLRNIVSEIHAKDAPINSYQGLPLGFEEFTRNAIRPAIASIMACLEAIQIKGSIRGDVPLESTTYILGEADMVCENLILELKCGMSYKAIELRESGNCKNLLQVFSYVALGRHGTIPCPCKWACIVNPLTASWEIYDMDTWAVEDSKEFMNILEELRLRS